MSSSPQSPPHSPSEDVIIRPSTAPAPTFSGMTPTLPSALRELRQHINNLDNDKAKDKVKGRRTPHPSEMTALARRFGGIRIDQSPNSDSSSSPKPDVMSDLQKQSSVNPIKLDFDNDEENNPNGAEAGLQNSLAVPVQQPLTSPKNVETRMSSRYPMKSPSSRSTSALTPKGVLAKQRSFSSYSRGSLDRQKSASDVDGALQENNQSVLQQQHVQTSLSPSPKKMTVVQPSDDTAQMEASSKSTADDVPSTELRNTPDRSSLAELSVSKSIEGDSVEEPPSVSEGKDPASERERLSPAQVVERTGPSDLNSTEQDPKDMNMTAASSERTVDQESEESADVFDALIEESACLAERLEETVRSTPRSTTTATATTSAAEGVQQQNPERTDLDAVAVSKSVSDAPSMSPRSDIVQSAIEIETTDDQTDRSTPKSAVATAAAVTEGLQQQNSERTDLDAVARSANDAPTLSPRSDFAQSSMETETIDEKTDRSTPKSAAAVAAAVVEGFQQQNSEQTDMEAVCVSKSASHSPAVTPSSDLAQSTSATETMDVQSEINVVMASGEETPPKESSPSPKCSSPQAVETKTETIPEEAKPPSAKPSPERSPSKDTAPDDVMASEAMSSPRESTPSPKCSSPQAVETKTETIPEEAKPSSAKPSPDRSTSKEAVSDELPQAEQMDVTGSPKSKSVSNDEISEITGPSTLETASLAEQPQVDRMEIDSETEQGFDTEAVEKVGSEGRQTPGGSASQTVGFEQSEELKNAEVSVAPSEQETKPIDLESDRVKDIKPSEDVLPQASHDTLVGDLRKEDTVPSPDRLLEPTTISLASDTGIVPQKKQSSPGASPASVDDTGTIAQDKPSSGDRKLTPASLSPEAIPAEKPHVSPILLDFDDVVLSQPSTDRNGCSDARPPTPHESSTVVDHLESKPRTSKSPRTPEARISTPVVQDLGASPRIMSRTPEASPFNRVGSLQNALRQHRASVHVVPSRADVTSSVDRIRSIRRSRMSWRTKLETPLLLGKREGSDDFGQMIQEESPRARSSSRMRASDKHGRLYTDKEVADIRQIAIDAVIEDLSVTHKDEVDRLNQDCQEKDRFLKKERAENEELKNVLEEYEAAINKMVEEANTQANTRERILTAEKNRLKAEVVELQDAFEQLKVRYDKAKQTMDVMTTKEARLIENIGELKKNMFELQTWSNDLKSNTEKKLNKAFDSVTSFRTWYLEQEAHAKKAMSDLAKAQTELKKETENHAETAKKVAKLEAYFHNEQDARAELNGELTTMKANLTRMTAGRDSIAAKFNDSQKETGVLRDKVNELEPRAVRADDFKKQIDTMRTERQGLKARAFDDITRIRELEDTLKTKEGEVEELSAICEEVMGQLEATKIRDEAPY